MQFTITRSSYIRESRDHMGACDYHYLDKNDLMKQFNGTSLSHV